MVFVNHLFNRIYSLHATASRAIQKFGSFWKVPHIRSVLSTLGIYLFRPNVIYRKRYKPALSHIMKVKIVLRDFVPLKQKGHILTFSKKVDFIERTKLYFFNIPYLKIIGNLVLKLILLTLSWRRSLSYRNQSIDLLWTVSYMIGTSFMKELSRKSIQKSYYLSGVMSF